MMIRRLMACILFVCCFTIAKSDVVLHFSPMYASAKMQLDSVYVAGGDTVSFSDFRLYISRLQLYRRSACVYKTDETKAFLLDWSVPGTCSITLPVSMDADSISFAVGIDSTISCSGVFAGDLDPVKGMYWAWQSGFINWKLEGTCSALASRNHKFQLHIGGYMQPYSTLRFVGFSLSRNRVLNLSIDLDALLQQIDIRKNYETVSPSAKAVIIAQILASLIKAGNETEK